MRRLPILLLVALLAACASGGDGGPRTAAPVSPGAATGAAADLLAFSATDLSGDPVEGSALRGQVLALWFWAPW